MLNKLAKKVIADLGEYDSSSTFKEQLEDLLRGIGQAYGDSVYKRLQREFLFYGPLEPLLIDESVTEILINAWDSIWYEKEGQLFNLSHCFLCPETYARTFQRVCELADINLDIENPVASTQLNGFRMSVVIPPLVPAPVLSFRRNGCARFNIHRLKNHDYLTERQMQILNDGIRSRKNILFIGNTGSGKTTLLNALLKTIPHNERVVILEDTDEIERPNSSSLKMATSEPITGKHWDLGELVKTSLRLRPDRIAVGEVRGGEASHLLMALSSGHTGSFCTLHADNPQTALSRLEALIQIGQPDWKPEVVRQLIHGGLHWIVHCERNEATGVRRIEGIYALRGLESTGFLIEQLDDELLMDSCVNV